MKKRNIIDGVGFREAKVEIIRDFKGVTDAARIFIEAYADVSPLSRTAKELLVAFAQILGHGCGFWYASPRESEKRLIKSCLRLSDKDYEDAIEEICKLKHFTKTRDKSGVHIDDEFICMVRKGQFLERFAVSTNMAKDGMMSIQVESETE